MTLECLLIPLAGHFLFYRSRDLGVSNDDLGRMLPLLPTPWPWSVFWCPWQDASSFTSLVTLECPAKPVAGCFLFYQSRNLGVSVKPLAGYFLFYQSRDLGVSSDALGRMLPLCPSVGLLVTDYMCEFQLLLNILLSEVLFESSQKELL